MEVRYLFLHPPDSTEILFSTPLIRALIKSVEHAEVISAVPKQSSWLLENNPYVSSMVVYEQSLSKHINEFRDLGADYLVDLTGSTKTSRFKNRLRVMDFTLDRKKIKQIRSLTDKKEAGEFFRESVMELLSVFGLKENGPDLDLFYGHNQAFVKRAIPESFLESYAVLDMPSAAPDSRDLCGPLSELISRIEHPLVLCGSEEWRWSGEEIMRRTGCTILGTCGDFSEQEQVYIRSGARILVNIEKGREIWSMVFKKPHFYIDVDAAPDSWKEQIKEMRNYLKLK